MPIAVLAQGAAALPLCTWVAQRCSCDQIDGVGGASQAAVEPSSLDTGISLTNAAARMNATHSARRSQVLSRRHQFSILEPCSRAIIAARVRLQRCCARLAAEAMRKAMVRPTKEALEVAYTYCALLGGSSIDVSGRDPNQSLRSSVLLLLAGVDARGGHTR